MTRKVLVAAVATLLTAGLSTSVPAQTLTDTVSSTAADGFSFSLADSGQARFTVVWDDAPDVLGLIVGCDADGDTLIFATSIPDQDRILTADVGVIGGLDCLALVDILVGTITNYTINLQVTSPDGNVLETAQLQPLAQGEATDRVEALAAELRRRAKALRELR